MVKIADIVVPLYNKALPVCERRGIRLNLDLSDPTIDVGDEAELKKMLQELLKAAIRRTKEGSITLGAAREDGWIEVVVRDSGEALTKKECEELATENIEVRSRHGYGTTVVIVL